MITLDHLFACIQTGFTDWTVKAEEVFFLSLAEMLFRNTFQTHFLIFAHLVIVVTMSRYEQLFQGQTTLFILLMLDAKAGQHQRHAALLISST